MAAEHILTAFLTLLEVLEKIRLFLDEIFDLLDEIVPSCFETSSFDPNYSKASLLVFYAVERSF